MVGKPRIPLESINQIRELYNQGIRRGEIAKKFNVTPAMVQYHTRDLPRQVRWLTTEEKRKIIEMRKQDYSCQDIAEEFGFHPQTVYQITRDIRIFKGLYLNKPKSPVLEILSELIDKGYFIVPRRGHRYVRCVRKLSAHLNIKKVALFGRKNSVIVCFLPDKKEEALKASLKLWKKKTTSYQELGILAQSFGIRLDAQAKRENVI